MTGVEILAMEEVVTASQFNWTAFWITVLGFAVFGTAVGICGSWYDRWYGAILGIITGAACGAIIGAALGGETFNIPTEYETQYKVAISDEVSMNDFLDKYEIVDQEGKIYTVRERNEP